MDQRLSLITLTVDDVSETARFFEEGLGWTSAGGVKDTIAFYQIGGLGLALYARSSLEQELGRLQQPGDPGTIAFAWNARTEAEVDTAFEKACAAGAKIIKAPHKAHWGGYSCYLEIPGGHMMELAYNPFWPIAEDGSVTVS